MADAIEAEARLGPEMAGWRLDRALAIALPAHSREQHKRWIAAGLVALDGRQTRDPARKVAGGEAVAVAIPEARPAHNLAQDLPLPIVHEDEHLLVVDKPAGMVVHPAAGNLDGTMVNALLHHCAGRLSGIGGVARPGIVHRIDKDTSGLLVVAKTDTAHVGLAVQFGAHTIGRRYLAIAAGSPRVAAGTVDATLARSSHDRKKMAIVEGAEDRGGRGKRAVTHWRLLETLRDAALIECRLETGRTHQVRVHMASIGHPLLGDPIYGRPRPEHRSALANPPFRRQALHAAGLSFVHPVSKQNCSFQSPLPADMQALLSVLAV